MGHDDLHAALEAALDGLTSGHFFPDDADGVDWVLACHGLSSPADFIGEAMAAAGLLDPAVDTVVVTDCSTSVWRSGKPAVVLPTPLPVSVSVVRRAARRFRPRGGLMATITFRGDRELARWGDAGGCRLVLTSRGRLLLREAPGRGWLSLRRGGTTIARATVEARQRNLRRLEVGA